MPGSSLPAKREQRRHLALNFRSQASGPWRVRPTGASSEKEKDSCRRGCLRWEDERS